MNKIKFFKKAFTMIELIVVIVIIGILSVVAMEKIHTSNLKSAAKSLANDLRYLQYLALNNDVYDGKDYNKKYWQIFKHCISENRSTCSSPDNTNAYTIFTDKAGNSTGQPHMNEIADDYLDSNKRLGGYKTGVSNKLPDNKIAPRTNLKKSFGIENVSFFYHTVEDTSKTGVTNIIFFNELGETFVNGPGGTKVKNSAVIVRLEKDKNNIKRDNSICIKIEKNTGAITIPKWTLKDGQKLEFGKTGNGKVRKIDCHKVRKNN